MLPHSGAFPEIVEDTEGGVIYEDNDPQPHWPRAIEQLLRMTPKGVKKMGRSWPEASHTEIFQRITWPTL